MADEVYGIQIEYDVDISGQVLTHTQLLRVALDSGAVAPQPGANPGAISLQTKGSGGTPGTTTALDAAADYVAVLLPFCNPALTITAITFVHYPFGRSANSIYIAPFDLTDTANFPSLSGSNAGGIAAGMQTTLTYFDSRGSTSKIVLLENQDNQDEQLSTSELGAPAAALNDYLIGSTSVVRGVGECTLLSLKRYSETLNTSTRNRRFRGR